MAVTSADPPISCPKPKFKDLKEMTARALCVLSIPFSVSPSSAPKKPTRPSSSLPSDHKPSSFRNPVLGSPLLLASRSVTLFPRRSLLSMAVLSMLPTKKPERAAAETVLRWSSRAIKSFSMVEMEARKLEYPNTGTEALLMGILVHGTDGEVTTIHLLLGIWSEKESAGHKILASFGFDDDKAKELAKSASKTLS